MKIPIDFKAFVLPVVMRNRCDLSTDFYTNILWYDDELSWLPL